MRVRLDVVLDFGDIEAEELDDQLSEIFEELWSHCLDIDLINE